MGVGRGTNDINLESTQSIIQRQVKGGVRNENLKDFERFMELSEHDKMESTVG